MAKTSTEAVRRWRAKQPPEKLREIGRLESQARRDRIPHLCLKSNYRLTHERARFLYEQMKTATCQICGTGKVVFDHDHKSGAFRGFLCQACNSGLGQFKDDPMLMARAIEYLSQGEVN